MSVSLELWLAVAVLVALQVFSTKAQVVVSQPVTASAKQPVSKESLGVPCGKPRLGQDDPFNLMIANFASKSLDADKEADLRAANVSLDLTIVGGTDAGFGQICWQVLILQLNPFSKIKYIHLKD
jgi:hypothetical protein